MSHPLGTEVVEASEILEKVTATTRDFGRSSDASTDLPVVLPTRYAEDPRIRPAKKARYERDLGQVSRDSREEEKPSPLPSTMDSDDNDKDDDDKDDENDFEPLLRATSTTEPKLFVALVAALLIFCFFCK